MAIKIVAYTEENTPQVVEFNARLRQQGVRFQFPESPQPTWLPPGESRVIYQVLYLAIDGGRAVRGGYILKSQPFSVDGKIRTIGNYQLPLSEGIINRAYGSVGLLMLGDALQRQPLLYCLGMGGLDRPLPRMLKTMGWSTSLVPFYFRVNQADGFLRNISYLRMSRMRRLALDFLAFSGLGQLVIRGWQGKSPDHTVHRDSYSLEAVAKFDAWADDIWHEVHQNYDLIAVRDSVSLQRLFPEDDDRFLRLKICENNRPVGWVIGMDTQLKAHRQFGNMRLGSIVDCLSLGGHETACLDQATGYLRQRGVDLIVSNQSHPAWQAGLAASGMKEGPSNFGLALSPGLVQYIESSTVAQPPLHFNRGDGDGPINL